MLKELERHFTQMGWYTGTHVFMTAELEGGFEAFSGRASETWEYRWIITIREIDLGKIKIPAVQIKGTRYENLDELAARVLKALKENDSN